MWYGCQRQKLNLYSVVFYGHLVICLCLNWDVLKSQESVLKYKNSHMRHLKYENIQIGFSQRKA